MPSIIDAVANGKCWLHSLTEATAAGTDAQGFPNPERRSDNIDGILCVWKAKERLFGEGNERSIGGQVRSLVKYKINIPHNFRGQPLNVAPQQKLELQQDLTVSDTITLEIDSVISESTVYYTLICTEVNA